MDAANSGTCQQLEEPAPACTVTFCGRGGPTAICQVSSQTATCAAWASRIDGGEKPQCKRFCTLECRIPKLVASDGSEHCNECVLHSFSCLKSFKVYGPVKNDQSGKCSEPIGIFEAPGCCKDFGIGCRKLGQGCSTGGSLVPPVGCAKGLTCVLRNFGFPAVDRPTSGKCRRVKKRVRQCSVQFCSKRGRRGMCAVSKQVATCGAWASRRDGGPNPKCDFACAEFCLIGKLRPRGSDGRFYCSRCALMQRSCATKFKVYGPVKK